MDVSGQLSLFDDFEMLLSGLSTACLSEKKTDATPKEDVDYLKKGERITDLAREKFERKYGSTFHFTDFEEKILGAKYGELEYPYSSRTDLSVLKPLATVFRKLLRSIKEVSDTDDGYVALKNLFGNYYDLTIEVSNLPRVFIGDFVNEDIALKVTVREGENYQISHGLSYSAPPKKRRNSFFTSRAIDAPYEGCTDLAYLFAYLYMLKVVGEEITRAKEENTVFYLENADLLEERYDKLFPEFFKNEPLLAEGCFEDSEIPFMEYVLKRPNLETVSRYEPLNQLREHGKIRVSKQDYGIFKKVNEIANIFSSPSEERVSPFLQTSTPNKTKRPNLYRSMPSWGIEIGLWYKLFLDAISEKADDLRTFQYLEGLKKTVATAFITKKNIPEKTLKAMKDSKFNDYFGYVEIDEDVDLGKVSEIAKEFVAVKETFFDGVDASDKTLRFRKLGKHKALGLYYPFYGCLCVDIHSPSSFIHEWGHLLDYKFGRASKYADFYEIRRTYTALLDREMKDDAQWKGHTKYNRAYYLEPTEIFARSFEIYMSRIKGVKNSLLKDTVGFAYPEDEYYLRLVKEYFDKFLVTINEPSDGGERS